VVGTRQAAWLTALLALGVALLLGSALPGAGGLESRGAEVVAPISRAIEDATRPLADVVHHAGDVQQLSEENAVLRQRVARLEADLAALHEQQLQSEQLAALVAAVGAAEAGRYVPAAVVFRDPAPARNALTIGRGERDGVRVGQAVLGPGATLVGVVADVEASRARVRLLSDADSAIAAVVQSSRTQAALAGAPGGLRLELVPVDARITVGDIVLSSALGGRLPGGLPAGRVSAVSQGPQELFATVEVEPLADYARLEQVLVLTDHEPPSGERAPAR
jgi:rod shape-determining protein MreC